MKLLQTLLFGILTSHLRAAGDSAATAVNQLGIDLQRTLPNGGDNLCLSPYSIQCAMAMTFAGADGNTRAEMAGVLHYPAGGASINDSFAALADSLETAKAKSAERAKQAKQSGGPSEAIALNVANRLFGQKGYSFEVAFLGLLKDHWHAPLEELDFAGNAEGARTYINGWVEGATQKRIRDLIPGGALSEATRLVLANALYLKAPWENKFDDSATKPTPFKAHGTASADVPTMSRKGRIGYGREDGFAEITLPYSGGGLQFLILLPDQPDGLPVLEAKLTAEMLAKCSNLQPREIRLFLPKFKFEPPTIPLKAEFERLGMKTAFDEPRGSADFDKMAPRRPNDYLYISDIFHKTFIAVDEQGTEAAAATAVLMASRALMVPTAPLEVRVDHPFVFAIQDTVTGACLFLGRVADPR